MNIELSDTTLASLVLIVFVSLLSLEAYFGRRLPRDLKGFYFRDIPRSSNPVQDAITALTYRNPSGKTIEDVLSEKNLVSYVFLDCIDKKTIEYDNNIIRIKWGQLSDGEKGVFEKVSLVKIGKSVLREKWQEGCPFKYVGWGQTTAVIDLDKIESYSVKIKTKMNIKSDSDFLRLINSQDWFLVMGFLDEEHKSKYPIMLKQDEVRAELKAVSVYSKGSIAVSIFLLAVTFPIALFVYFCDSATLFGLLVDVCVCLSLSVVVCTIAFCVERLEKYSVEEYEITKQIRGLKNWIEDFTTIKDQPPSASIVWGDFIKWSYLLGVSEKAIRIAEKYSNITIVKPPHALENAFAIRLSSKLFARTIIMRCVPFPLNLVVGIVMR